MNATKVAVATALGSLTIGLATLAAGPLVAEAASQALVCTTVAGPGTSHHGVCHFQTAVYLKAPLIRQSMRLDCESAALTVALQTKHIALTQSWVFSELPKETRSAVVSRQRPVTWGDPYAAFVGNVQGSESNYTGYGVYWPPIAAVAVRAGVTAIGHTGWTLTEIELQVRMGNPVVVWTNYNFAYSRTSTWRAWDGRVIPYTNEEHTVTVIGFNSVTGTVTVVDVGVGLLRTISAAQFSAAIATFEGMAVAIS